MTFSRIEGPVRRLPRGAVLAALVALSLGLCALPPRWFAAPRQMLLEALRPGQRFVAEVRGAVADARQRVAYAVRFADEQKVLQDELDSLTQENQRLRAALAAASVKSASQNDASTIHAQSSEPLLEVDGVEARVLGHRARSVLARHGLLDVGTSARVEPGRLVLDGDAAWLDLGRDAALETGQFALAGGNVWGRLVEVGGRVSIAQRVTASGYRDLVQIGRREGGQWYVTARGVLEGTGEPEARIRFVEVTAPIAAGDHVYTAPGDGLLDVPLFYGQVTRVEQVAGAVHWEIRMLPAAAEWPDRVTVVTAAPNPARLASNSEGANDTISR